MIKIMLILISFQYLLIEFVKIQHQIFLNIVLQLKIILLFKAIGCNTNQQF